MLLLTILHCLSGNLESQGKSGSLNSDALFLLARVIKNSYSRLLFEAAEKYIFKNLPMALEQGCKTYGLWAGFGPWNRCIRPTSSALPLSFACCLPLALSAS